ncbi:c-type cytochrome [Aliishimia ponticola]|uniref:C-type cytochrome n=1 Tax=Aliishimia ponticola TaxID=2499833 RepID=A0A4S4N6T6_9RHOB|nr:c-type cytochrome [Aliishimia ponticola]THH34854.1 c-type cytochrome [Aliishimia ponticola]
MARTRWTSTRAAGSNGGAFLRRWWGAVVLAALIVSPVAAQEFTTLKGHGGPIMGIAVSPQGQVATASFDNSVGLWQGRTPTWLEGHAAAVTAIAFGPGGILYTGGDDFALRQWGASARELGRHDGKITSITVSDDGARIATGSWDGSIRLWSSAGDFRALPAPGAGVNAVAFEKGGGTLFAATSQGVVWRYDLEADTQLPLVKHGFGVNRLVVGDEWLAYGAVDGGTRVIDLDGREIADFTLDRRPILAMAHHPETGQIAVGDGHGYIMMLDAHEWRITHDFRATRNGPVWALAFSNDGTVLHAGGLDDAVYSWPVAFLDQFDPAIDGQRSFLRDAATMPNGERQFMRKCSICHALQPGPSRKAGPSLHGVFGRRAGTLAGYRYSDTLDGSSIIWTDETIDALFDTGPDHYIPGSKMPMQVIAKAQDRADLIAFLKQATRQE